MFGRFALLTLVASLTAPPARSPRRRALAAAAALACMAVVTYLSSLAQPDIPPGPWAWSDKLTHAAVFGTIGLLWALAAARPGARAVLAAVAITAAFGAADEFHQSFTPGRDASLLDLLADTVGATAGALLVTWYSARRWAPPSSASRESPPASPPTSSSPITSR